jgi:hypothetical protein
LLAAALAVTVQVPPAGTLLGAVKIPTVLSLGLAAMVPQELCQLAIAVFACNCTVCPATTLDVRGDNDSAAGVVVGEVGEVTDELPEEAA